jgi:hypothetical protein
MRSASREMLTYDEFDSCWSDASSLDGDATQRRRRESLDGASSSDRSVVRGKKGLFMGSLEPEFDSRARHVARPSPSPPPKPAAGTAMVPGAKFEERHRQLCKWHELPFCVACGFDGGVAGSISSGIGSVSLVNGRFVISSLNFTFTFARIVII